MTGACRKALAGRLLLLCAFLCLAPSEVAAEDAETLLPLDHFSSKPQVREVTLSPDGSRIAYLLREPYGTSVWLLDLGSGEDAAAVQRFASRLVESLHWSTDGSGLFVETQDRLAWLPVVDGRPRWIYQLLGASKNGFEATVLGVDPITPRHMLIAEELEPGHPREPRLYRLLRVDPQSQVEVLLESEQPIRRFLLDGSSKTQRGAVRYLRQAVDGELVIWRLGRAGDLSSRRQVMRCRALDPCVPIAYAELAPLAGGSSDTRRERLWLRGTGGEDLTYLYSIDLAIPGSEGELTIGPAQRVHGDPQSLADLDSVVLDRLTGRPLLAIYDSDRRRLFGIDDLSELRMSRLRQRLPEARLVVETSSTGPVWLIEESGPALAQPRHHLYDLASDTLRPILRQQRQRGEVLPEEALVEPHNITWAASDGLLVHGLLWLPEGVEAATAPVVVRMHGGPWNHVRRRWSVVSQFLANRGYVVFEPNFRSSTGFGRAYIEAAQGDFGDGRVQQDMLEGLEHLHRQGIGDRERVAILGHSFGGFSTLGAMAFTPRRFVAGVASAPPIDLVRALQDLPDDHRMANGLIQKEVVLPLVGDLEDPQVVAALRRKSPEAHLAATERPLLIFAGGADPKVDIVDVKHYAAALERLGRDVSLVVDDEQGHSFEHEVSIGAYLYLLERFLGHHLGGAVGGVEDPRIAAYLETRILLSGPSLQVALGR